MVKSYEELKAEMEHLEAQMAETKKHERAEALKIVKKIF